MCHRGKNMKKKNTLNPTQETVVLQDNTTIGIKSFSRNSPHT